jgi:hypothetical protein
MLKREGFHFGPSLFHGSSGLVIVAIELPLPAGRLEASRANCGRLVILRKFAIFREVLEIRQEGLDLILAEVHPIVGDMCNAGRMVLFQLNIVPTDFRRESLQADLATTQPYALLRGDTALLQTALVAVPVFELNDTKASIGRSLPHFASLSGRTTDIYTIVL